MATTTLDSTIAATTPALAVPLDVRLKVDAADFAALCAANRDLRLEREADGGLTVMSPASGQGGRRNLTLGARLWIWNEAAKLGYGFDSSAGFTLPDGSVRTPDLSWIRADRWDRIAIEEQARFPRIVPDFVAELRSPSEAARDLRAKMEHYVAQGVRLGWLIDPETQAVEVYRPGQPPEILAKPTSLDGGDVLPGFTLDLKGVLFD